MSELIASAETPAKDALEAINKVQELRKATEDTEKITEDAFNTAFTTVKINYSFDDNGELNKFINNFGKLTIEETPHTELNFRGSRDGDDKIRLEWNNINDNEVIPPVPVMYSVEEEGYRNDNNTIKYIGEECMCTIQGIELSIQYEYNLRIKLGELTSRIIDCTECGITNRHFALNGMIYCGRELLRCNCDKNCKTCGENDTECQCFTCEDAQNKYALSYRGNCPNGHPLEKIGHNMLKNKKIFCGICKKPFTKCLTSDVIFPMCKECAFYVCYACLPRIYPIANCTEKDEFGKICDIPSAHFEPIQGVQKWYVCSGAVYCGRNRGGDGSCRCGECGPLCGPSSGCSCDECVDDLRSIINRAHLTCKKGHELTILNAFERKSKLFKTTCDSCGDAIPMDGCNGYKLALSCTKCNFDICPRCIHSKVPFDVIPHNIYSYCYEADEDQERDYTRGAAK